MKGGNAAYIYTYDEGCKGGSGLLSPLNPGGKLPDISNITFCWNACPDDCEETKDETGFGGNTKGGGRSWWYYFDTSTECQKIYAGQKEVVGASVCYSGGKLIITLADGWQLDASAKEPVKIQGYNDDSLPKSRPAAGRFTTYKGSDLTVAVDSYRYFVIHLDLLRCL